MADFNVQVYNVSVTFPIVPAEAKADQAQSLADALADTVDPGSWEAMGGQGSVRIFQRLPNVKSWLLVVRQTTDNHKLIADVLSQLNTK